MHHNYSIQLMLHVRHTFLLLQSLYLKFPSYFSANIDPVPGNDHELDEPGPGDGAYDTVWPVETSGSKSKAPVENALPPVYAAVDKNNREGNTVREGFTLSRIRKFT